MDRVALEHVALEHVALKNDGDLSKLWTTAVQGLRKGGLIILISDLLDDAESLVKTIRAIRYSGRPLIVIQVILMKRIFHFKARFNTTAWREKLPLPLTHRALHPPTAKNLRDIGRRSNRGVAVVSQFCGSFAAISPWPRYYPSSDGPVNAI